MRHHLVLMILLLYHLRLAQNRPPSGEDGFRRLLRRSATLDKYDRPLVREERNIEDDVENDDDAIVTRNRRSNEDKFYQTLLSRTESKQQDKRSYDTEDSDNKAGFIIREDWTGDSKISDADRQELENLFNTLNPGDEDEAKNDEVREVKIEDEPESVEEAAKDYTSWLLKQKPSQFTKSLSHKIEVDHELSKMFYKSSLPAVAASKETKTHISKPKKASAKNTKGSARFGIAAVSKLPAICSDNSPECICTRACSPRPVASASPCNCGMPPPPPPPPPPSAKRTSKVAFNTFNKPCDKNDAKCLCARSCYPRPVAKTNPCDCGASPAPAPAPPPSSIKAPPVCKPNDAKCLCARTCHPQPVAKADPCDCGMPPAPAPAPPPASLKTALAPVCKPNDAKCLCAKSCHPRPVSKVSPCDCGMPPAPAPAPPPAGYKPQVAGKAAPACKPNDAKCLCTRACYPRPVTKVSPCDCGMPPAPAPAPAPPPASLQTQVAPVCKPGDAKCLCARACHPRPVSKVNPCDCEMPGPAPAPVPAPPPPPAKLATAVCKPNDAKCICARACYPKPVAKTSPCNCGMPAPPPPAPAPAPAPAPPPASAQTRPEDSADTKSNTPAATWCTKACHPRHVISSNPCQCHPSEAVAAPVRSPKPVSKARDDHEIACAKTCHPRPVSSTLPCACGIPSSGDNNHNYPIESPSLQVNTPSAQALPIAAQPLAPQGKQADTQAPARSSVASKKNKDEIKNIQSAISDVSAPATPEAYVTKDGQKTQYLDTRAKNYQGCYKDKKPGRDLQRRFTRYAMTPEVCLRECKYQGYNFAGLQYSYLCFCGNAFGRYGKVDDAFCNSRCLGDKTRPCGAFWHNSVYSVGKKHVKCEDEEDSRDESRDPSDEQESKDYTSEYELKDVAEMEKVDDTDLVIDGREYDPTDFDFMKVDADEAKKDAVAQKQGFDANKFSSATKANVANNLVKAAEAALKAAKKLLPDSKNKVLTRRAKGGKHKREDDEDPELEEMKMSAMASLKAAKKYLRKTELVDPAKHKEKEKRSIEVGDESWVNLDNGKDLLVAYLGGIADYRRQTRSVDDEDEDDLEANDDKPKFEYRRMTLGASGDGEFINRFDDDVTKTDEKTKRSIPGSDVISDSVKILLPVSANVVAAKNPSKRDVSESTAQATSSNNTEVSNSTASNSTASNSTSGLSNETATTTALPNNTATLTETFATPSNASLLQGNTSLPVNSVTSLPVNSTAESNNVTVAADIKSISVNNEKTISIRKRRSLDEDNDDEQEADGVKKMAARGENKDVPQTEVKRQTKEDDDVSESDFARLLSEEADAEQAVEHQIKRSTRGSENHESEDDYVAAENEKEARIKKRDTKEKKEYNQLRGHVETGVEKLMALVVNLYKEQSTIKGFEDSVRDLKDDIAKQLKLSPDKRDEIMKEIRNEIQNTASKKLKDLTSSIRSEIKSFAKSHPANQKKAETAISSLPDLPISDADYSRARREISKRGAELDDVENQFQASDVPSILKEHFKRNAEEKEFNGETMLSRNHRNVPEDDTLDDELSEIVDS